MTRRTTFRNEAVCPMSLIAYAVVMVGHRDGGATVTVENTNNGAVVVERELDDLDDALTFGNAMAANIRQRVAQFWEVDV